MKFVIVFVLLVLSMPFIQAISVDQAVAEGRELIKSNAKVGAQGVSVVDYNIKPLAVYSNGYAYRVVYELSTAGKSRGVMVEINKSDGKVLKVFVSHQENSIKQDLF